MATEILTPEIKQLIDELQLEVYSENGIVTKELQSLENSFLDYGITTQEKAQFRTQFSIAVVQTLAPTIFNAAIQYALLDSKIQEAAQAVLTEKAKTDLTIRQRKAFDDDILRITVEQWANIASMAVSVESAKAQDTIDKFEEKLANYASISCSQSCTDTNSLGKKELDEYNAEQAAKEDNTNG